MTPLEQFNEEVLLKIDKNVDYDEAEINCNWGVGELKRFITQTLTAHKELILRMAREKVPSCESRECILEREQFNRFLNNLDTI